VVTAAEMLSVAAFLHDRHAQAFPSFGSERMGAPVVAYCRIDSAPIRTHDPVSDVDCSAGGSPMSSRPGKREASTLCWWQSGLS
jgi:Pyruvate/2-oxoacid:ferredoxin oxidoreductase gamma subunit